ncbi:MAG: ABC transporter ATP-binding protein [Nitrospirota bacterium]|nr:ABC transporter ATP-binding protein [Nitrospirota bacterium]
MASRVHPLLQVSNLRTSFFTDKGEIKAVDDVSFTVHGGQTLALVGESACGKSVTALSIMRLLSSPGRVVGGTINFNGQNLLSLPETAMRKIRGKSIAMVFQEPMTSLNPVMRIGDQIGEVLKIHTDLSNTAIRQEVIGLLEKVRIASPKQRIDQYPHEMSGGMKQRVMIAMALACKPDLLIADEPTTALDVTIQAQILDLLADLQKDLGMAILLITHNLGVVAQFSQDVIVMYASKIAERASVKTLFQHPSHPYTQALLKSLPRPGERQVRLEAIPGTVPSPLQYPTGCHFSSRCTEVLEQCPIQPPPTIQVGDSHEAVCWLHAGQHS